MEKRKAELERNTKETEIKAEVNIDGKGAAKIKTNIGILDHMIELFVFHGHFDLNLKVAKADLEIDIHHTNEDVGIVLGKVFKKALDEKHGIKRFGYGFAPMESTLAKTIIDISGRGYLSLNIGEGQEPIIISDQDGYAIGYLEHFFESFAHSLGATIHIDITNPSEDLHTNLEAVFKSFGLAMDQATQIDARRSGVIPSTKGIID